MDSNGASLASETTKKLEREDAVECILSAERDKDYFR